MMAEYGSITKGSSFDESTVDVVWREAQPALGYDASEYGEDMCGARIRRRSYGATGEYGWEIDHIKPVALGGSDELSNLQPLHWRNNRRKGDNYPRWTCEVTSN